MKKVRNGYGKHTGYLFKIPVMGYGTIIPEGPQTITAVKAAIRAGFRNIDTAAAYRNEGSVGQAVREAVNEYGLRREDIFVSTKAWFDHRGYEKTLRAFEESMEKLKLDYLDLYLIHWPANAKWHPDDWRKLNADTWRALEKLYKEGRVKAIGVSNFLTNHLKALMEDAEIKPMVDQIEFHPGFAQWDTASFAQENGIVVEAWSPFGGDGSHVLSDETIRRIADTHGKGTAQTILRWLYQKEIVALPKTTNPDHILSNTQIFDFSLSDTEMKEIDSVPYCGGMQFDPDTAKS